MNTKEIRISKLDAADYAELKRLGNLKLPDLRSAIYNDIGGSYGHKGEWSLEKITRSNVWSRGDMIAHLFDLYLTMRANKK